jgi:hypothetical protein
MSYCHYSKRCVIFHSIQLSASVLEVPLRMMQVEECVIEVGDLEQ